MTMDTRTVPAVVMEAATGKEEESFTGKEVEWGGCAEEAEPRG